MLQQFFGSQTLTWVLPENRVQQAFPFGRDAVRNREESASNLGEESGRIVIVERVSSAKHGEQHHPQTPYVRSFGGVSSRGLQDFWTYVGGAAVFVVEDVATVADDDGVVQCCRLCKDSG